MALNPSGFSSSNTLTTLPKDLLIEIRSYLELKSQIVFRTTNIFLSSTLPHNVFQFNAKDLDEAFCSHLIVRQEKYLACVEGQFRIKNLNFPQRFFRRCFGCYKETHLKNVANGCSLIAAQSKLNIKNYRDRCILKGIAEKILSKKPVNPPFTPLSQFPNTYITIQEALSVPLEDEMLVGRLDVMYSRAYGIDTNFGVKVRFVLDITNEYVHFIVMDPSYSIEKKTNVYMQLGPECKAHAANESFLEHDHPKYLKLCTAAYKIAQSLALKAHVDIITPVGVNPNISKVLNERGFELIRSHLQPHWKWTCTALDDLPTVKINLEFDW